MQHTNSNTKYSFKCDRWLSKDEDDHQIIRELPAFGPDIEPLPGNDGDGNCVGDGDNDDDDDER